MELAKLILKSEAVFIEYGYNIPRFNSTLAKEWIWIRRFGLRCFGQ